MHSRFFILQHVPSRSLNDFHLLYFLSIINIRVLSHCFLLFFLTVFFCSFSLFSFVLVIINSIRIWSYSTCNCIITLRLKHKWRDVIHQIHTKPMKLFHCLIEILSPLIEKKINEFILMKQKEL